MLQKPGLSAGRYGAVRPKRLYYFTLLYSSQQLNPRKIRSLHYVRIEWRKGEWITQASRTRHALRTLRHSDITIKRLF